MENGFQTTVPPSKRRHYNGEETDHWAVPPVAPEGIEPWFRDQASQLRDALVLAHCQPEVGAFFNFELIDEDRLAGWQSGVMWRDGTRKPSYEAFREAVGARAVRQHRLRDGSPAQAARYPRRHRLPTLDSPG